MVLIRLIIFMFFCKGVCQVLERSMMHLCLIVIQSIKVRPVLTPGVPLGNHFASAILYSVIEFIRNLICVVFFKVAQNALHMRVWF